MFEQQKGCCAICDRHQTDFKRNLSVDHCHTTDKIRGLLCHSCNVILGHAKDNKQLFVKTINYLDKYA